MQVIQNRRHFLTGFSAAVATLASAAVAGAEPPPETTRVRLPVFAGIADCLSPIYVSEDLLGAEGFTEVTFVSSGTGPDSSDWLEHDEIDFDWNFTPSHIRSIAKGVPITVLTGAHVGCLELMANDRIYGVADLKGKRVGVDAVNGNPYLLVMMMAAYVGLDPVHDIEWVTTPDPVAAFAEGKIDAFLATPPQPQVMRERKLGHVILKTAVDRPWSHYYCCMLASSAQYAQRYPVATKRVLRALLKAVDLCVSDPERVARVAVEKGFGSRYDYTLQTMTDARYDTWRDYDPEDTIRFYALRLQETGMIKASPQEIIANGTNWRFHDELRRELKT